MKILKKFLSAFLIIFFAFPLCMIQTNAQGILIVAPPTRSKNRYYIADRINTEKYHIDEINENTRQKNHGAFVKRIRFGEYVIYDDTASDKEFTHIIQAIDSDNYVVAIRYPCDQLVPILKISRDPSTYTWHIQSCHIIGRIGLPSPEVYIEKTSNNGDLLIKSAVSTPEIDSGETYNKILQIDYPDEFSDIISFFAAFLFK